MELRIPQASGNGQRNEKSYSTGAGKTLSCNDAADLASHCAERSPGGYPNRDEKSIVAATSANAGNRERGVSPVTPEARPTMPLNGLQDFDLLTLADVARVLLCSKAHACKAVAGRIAGSPPIPAVHLGRRILVRRASLLTWIEQNERAASGMMPISPERGAGKRA